ncbi:MAG: RNase adapter RapZ [Actinomycetota bacterium]
MTRERNIELIVITGMSGAGRSEAAKAMEDLGWYVIDNLPPQLIEQMLALALSPGNLISRVALVIDARGGILDEADRALQALEKEVGFTLVFLEASDEVLVRRFDATHRRHPLAAEGTAADGIREERRAIQPFRERADLVIDTSELTSRDLRMKISGHFGGDDRSDGLKTTIVSFGYKYGLPLDADMVLDVRFLPNPHWIDSLRPFTGLDGEIKEYVLGKDDARTFLERVGDLLDLLLPSYVEEGRHYLTIAVGCTGGRHRSVVLATEIAAFLGKRDLPVSVVHRDVDRSPVAR